MHHAVEVFRYVAQQQIAVGAVFAYISVKHHLEALTGERCASVLQRGVVIVYQRGYNLRRKHLLHQRFLDDAVGHYGRLDVSHLAALVQPEVNGRAYAVGAR